MTTIVSQSSAPFSLRATLVSGLGVATIAFLVLTPWTMPCGAACSGSGWSSDASAHNETGAVTSTVAIVDVTMAFTQEGFDAWSSLGGVAGEVPLSNPAHVFRFQPTDRVEPSVDRHMFFLEDPGHAPGCRTPTYRNPGNLIAAISLPTHIDADVVVYRIDGDLVIDNAHALSLQLNGRYGQDIVFDVEGDIIFGDDLLRGDGLGEITFRARPGIDGQGGTIFLDDVTYGTLRMIEANLDADRLVTGRINPAGVVIRGEVFERSVARAFSY